MGQNKIHPRYECPRCKSKNTVYKGRSPSKTQKPRYKCRDCLKTWTMGSIGRGGDRKSEEFQSREVALQPVPKREGHFSPSRKIDGKLIPLVKTFENTGEPDKAWEAAKTYRKQIAPDCIKSRVAVAYDGAGSHTGHYAVYAQFREDGQE